MNLFQWLKTACADNQQPAVHVPNALHTPPVRKLCCFSGHVQGVGFRYEAKMVATQLDLTGWAQNKSDGTVVVEIEGEESCIDEFLRVIQAVSRFGITDVWIEDLPCSKTETAFKVLY